MYHEGIRKRGEIIGRSTSRAHRHIQGIKKRNRHPELSQWVTNFFKLSGIEVVIIS